MESKSPFLMTVEIPMLPHIAHHLPGPWSADLWRTVKSLRKTLACNHRLQSRKNSMASCGTLSVPAERFLQSSSVGSGVRKCVSFANPDAKHSEKSSESWSSPLLERKSDEKGYIGCNRLCRDDIPSYPVGAECSRSTRRLRSS